MTVPVMKVRKISINSTPVQPCEPVRQPRIRLKFMLCATEQVVLDLRKLTKPFPGMTSIAFRIRVDLWQWMLLTW
jgi:hypothetical protein